jgi:hypothetical protein
MGAQQGVRLNCLWTGDARLDERGDRCTIGRRIRLSGFHHMQPLQYPQPIGIKRRRF